MMTASMTETMQAMLLEAYAHPDRPNVLYAGAAQTGSDRLNALPQWDWTPQPSAHVPGVSTCLFPLSLGCPPVCTSEGKEWVRPLITDPAQVASLRVPDVWEGRSGAVLHAIEEMTRTLPAGQLIREPDIQSPLGIAELMWDETFYMALLEEPAAMHQLLEKITDFLIAFIREARRIAGPRYNGAGFPVIWGDAQGTMVADDTMSLISPSMHLEFSVPYLNRLADACGPLYYHSCTWRAPYFDNIHQIRNVRAYNWNPGNSDDPAVIIREFSGKAVLAPHICADMHLDNDLLAFHFTDEAELLRYMLEHRQADTSLYFWFSNVVNKGPVIERMYDLLEDGGFTPRARGLA